jgi:hypothetical protein
MQLNEFITETLNQIFKGISDSKQSANKNGFQVNPWIVKGASDMTNILVDRQTKTPLQIVEFDVAVTTVDSKKAKGGAGVFVAGLGIGGQMQSDTQNNIVSRIKFSVPIALPRASR